MKASASELPQDLINLVLLRLPASSVARFRCVSKPWRSFLTSSTFVKSHHDLHMNSSCATSIVIPVSPDKDADPPVPPHLHVITTDGRSRKVTSPFFRGQSIILHGVCHGFILVELQGHNSVLVFNPVTLEAVEVSGCIIDITERGGYGSWCHFGLGYDSSSDEYKIVRLLVHITDDFGEISEWDVYSLKKKSWSRLRNPDPPISLTSSYLKSLSFVNGRLHCRAWSDNRGYVILAFDLAREEFEEISPPSNGFHSIGGVLTVFGRWFAVVYSLDDDHLSTDFWVMKEYGVPESWHKMMVNAKCANDEFIFLPGEDELVHILSSLGGNVYSLSTGVLREWDVGCDIRLMFAGVSKGERALPFTECLLSPTTYENED